MCHLVIQISILLHFTEQHGRDQMRCGRCYRVYCDDNALSYCNGFGFASVSLALRHRHG